MCSSHVRCYHSRVAGPYGTAWDVALDLHPSLRSITSLEAGDAPARLILANAIVRTLDTPQGSLPDAPSRGYDMKRLILHEMAQDQLDAEAAQMEEQINLDERVVSATVDLKQTRTTGGLVLTIVVTVDPDFDGPFSFTITAAEAAIEVTL